jgi:hypothetical protein
MPRKTKRRPFRAARPQQRTEDTAQRQRQLESAAQSLLNSRSPAQLQSELVDRETLLAEADQAAQMDPSPANLARYRAARSEHEAAQLAVEIVNRSPSAR